jgi:hypothetical protein
MPLSRSEASGVVRRNRRKQRLDDGFSWPEKPSARAFSKSFASQRGVGGVDGNRELVPTLGVGLMHERRCVGCDGRVASRNRVA